MCRWNGLPQIHNHHYSHTSIVSFFCVLFLTPSEPHRNGRSCEIDVWRVKCLNIVGPWQIKFLFWFAEWFVIQNYHISTVWNLSIRFASRGPKKAVRWQKREKKWRIEYRPRSPMQWLRWRRCVTSFVALFSFVDLHFISVYKLPFSRCFPPCNERFAFALWSGKLPRPSMR